MYVSATSPRFSRGRSTPATLAICPPRSYARLRPSGSFTIPPRIPLHWPSERRLRRRRRNPPGGRYWKGGEAPLRGLPLPLLVTRVLADDPRHALALDDLAVLAPGLDRRFDLHVTPLSSSTDSPRSFEPIGDPAAGEVVRGQLHLHAVTGQDPDEVHPHLAADVGQHPMAVLEFHPEHRVREWLDHGPLDLDRVLFRHLARS